MANAAGIGILGGSFDPIHHGHLRLAEEAIERLGLDHVLLIPARPWQRPTEASAEHRLHMVELACLGNARLIPESLEIDRKEPSYTVDTLRTLRSRLGSSVPLWLILGADAFLRLPSWHEWTSLEALCHLAVVPRPRIEIEACLPEVLAPWWSRRALDPAETTGRLALLEAPQLEISATAIRAQLKQKHSPRYLLPDPVLDYILSEGLYR